MPHPRPSQAKKPTLPEILNSIAFVLLAAYLLTAGGLIAWIFLTRQQYVPQTPAFALRAVLRLGLLFALLWLACEKLNLTATTTAILLLVAYLFAPIFGLFDLGGVALLWILAQLVLGFPARRELTLEPPPASDAPPLPPELIGQTGIAVSALRPAGKVEIDHHTYNATTEDNDFLESGAPVIVRDIADHRLTVARTH